MITISLAQEAASLDLKRGEPDECFHEFSQKATDILRLCQEVVKIYWLCQPTRRSKSPGQK